MARDAGLAEALRGAWSRTWSGGGRVPTWLPPPMNTHALHAAPGSQRPLCRCGQPWACARRRRRQLGRAPRGSLCCWGRRRRAPEGGAGGAGVRVRRCRGPPRGCRSPRPGPPSPRRRRGHGAASAAAAAATASAAAAAAAAAAAGAARAGVYVGSRCLLAAWRTT